MRALIFTNRHGLINMFVLYLCNVFININNSFTQPALGLQIVEPKQCQEPRSKIFIHRNPGLKWLHHPFFFFFTSQLTNFPYSIFICIISLFLLQKQHGKCELIGKSKNTFKKLKSPISETLWKISANILVYFHSYVHTQLYLCICIILNRVEFIPQNQFLHSIFPLNNLCTFHATKKFQ